MNEHEAVDLSADSPPSAKRARQLDNCNDVRSMATANNTVDLTVGSPEEGGFHHHCAASTTEAITRQHEVRQHWGELESATAAAISAGYAPPPPPPPPRWHASQRRSGYRPAVPSTADTAASSVYGPPAPMDVDVIDLCDIPELSGAARCPPSSLRERVSGRPSLSFLYGRERGMAVPARATPPIPLSAPERKLPGGEAQPAQSASSHLQRALDALVQQESTEWRSIEPRAQRHAQRSSIGIGSRSAGQPSEGSRAEARQAVEEERRVLDQHLRQRYQAQQMSQHVRLEAIRAATAQLQRRAEALGSAQRSSTWAEPPWAHDDNEDEDDADIFEAMLGRRHAAGVSYRERRDGTGSGGPRYEASSLQQLMMGMVEASASDGGAMRGLGSRGALDSIRQVLYGASGGAARLPPHMLFTDRDFNENDYEALLALDDGIENRKGAKTEEIDSIPILVVPGIPAKLEACIESRCAICLGDYSPGEQLRQPTCGHAFHKDCLDTWLSSKAVCPICQQSCR